MKRLFDALRHLFGPLSQAQVDAINAALAEDEARAISAAGLDLIKRFEGLRLDAYRCPAGVPTIGYGSTGPHVRIGQRISKAEADELLTQDAARFVRGVSERLGDSPATQSQFDAMVSLAFNIGLDAFARSTLLRKHKAGDYAGAQKEFGRWVNSAGKRLLGLVHRRAAEATLYGKAET